MSYSATARRILGEAVVSPEDMDAIMAIIQRNGHDIEAMNAELAPYNVVFDANHPTLRQYGAPAMADPDTHQVILSPHLLNSPGLLRVVIDHELVHVGQFRRAAAQGRSVPNMLDKPHTTADLTTHPLELMAYARTAVTSMRAMGYGDDDILKALKSGGVRVGLPPDLAATRKTDPAKWNKFLRYAADYLG